MNKWEYRTVTRPDEIGGYDFDEFLNGFGNEGWELVGFTKKPEQESQNTAAFKILEPPSYTFIFKRIQDQEN